MSDSLPSERQAFNDRESGCASQRKCVRAACSSNHLCLQLAACLPVCVCTLSHINRPACQTFGRVPNHHLVHNIDTIIACVWHELLQRRLWVIWKLHSPRCGYLQTCSSSSPPFRALSATHPPLLSHTRLSPSAHIALFGVPIIWQTRWIISDSLLPGKRGRNMTSSAMIHPTAKMSTGAL